MANLYIFGIGGTGSRVIKSLAMLLASGVKITTFDEIIPIIIDPDRANGDLNRTIEILKNYQRIREKLDRSHHDLFYTKISTLNEAIKRLDDVTLIREDYKLTLDNVQSERFRDFIDHGPLNEKTKNFTEILFSEINLNSTLEMGFKGNPNIGSVVLNQLSNSNEFKAFASSFADGDRIFIISSIFGGTGAAGFPLILKNLRNADDSLPNHALIQKARIGAVTLLPYFGVQSDENSRIDKATFISKSKAALSYYAKNVNNSIDAMYYLGDKISKDYDNHQGEKEQKNEAHFVELAAALSIIDFASMSENEFTNPKFKEFGINSEKGEFDFSSLGNKTKRLILKNLAQYKFFTFYLKHQLENSIGIQPYSIRGKKKIDKVFLTNDFYNDFLKKFNQHFDEWIKEMDINKVSFRPFNLQVDSSNLFRLINGYEPNKKFPGKQNFALFDHLLNKAEREIKDLPVEEKFMTIFFKATNEIMTKKYDINYE